MKMWRGFQLILCGWLFCALLPATAAAEMRTMTLANDMSINLPDNWRVAPPEPGGPQFMAVAVDKEDKPFGMVMVNQLPLGPDDESLTQDRLPQLNPEERESFLDEMEASLRYELDSGIVPLSIRQILSKEIKSLNGFNAASVTAALDAGGNGVIMEVVVIVFSDRAVQLQIWCEEAHYQEHGREMADIVNSFKAGK